MHTLIPPDILSLFLCLAILTIGTRSDWRIHIVLIGCALVVAVSSWLGLIGIGHDGQLDYSRVAELHFPLSLRVTLIVSLLLPIPFIWLGYRFSQMRYRAFLSVSLWVFVICLLFPKALFDLEWALWNWGYADLGWLLDTVIGQPIFHMILWICSIGGMAGMAFLLVLPIINLVFHRMARGASSQ